MATVEVEEISVAIALQNVSLHFGADMAKDCETANTNAIETSILFKLLYPLGKA